MITERKKHIVSITTLATTMESFVLDSMVYMKEKGWNVTLMCNMTPRLTKITPSDIQCISIPMERNFNLFRAFKCIWQMFIVFRKQRPTIVQYGTTHAALFGSIAAWIARVPIRINLQWGIYDYNSMGIIGKFYWFVEWLTCKLSTDIRPVSAKNLEVSIKEKLFKEGKGKVLGYGGTIGVKLGDYCLEKKGEWNSEIRKQYFIAKDSYVFGFVGRLSRDKGSNELLKAFRLFEKDKDTILLLIGPNEGGLDEKLMEWANANKKVVITGRVDHDKMAKYIATLDVLVHPTYREGFGMVLQEAMAMAVPVITTDIPGPSEVIEVNKTGVLVPARDVNALENSLETAYNNKEEFVKYGLCGRKRVEECFERSKMLFNIYEDKEELLTKYNLKN